MSLERLVCFSASCRVSLGRPIIPYCNLFKHINWRPWINCNNVCLPLNCWRGRRYLSHYQSLSEILWVCLNGYFFFKDNVFSCLNLSLTRDVDLECLWRFIVSFLSKGSSLDFFSLGTWMYMVMYIVCFISHLMCCLLQPSLWLPQGYHLWLEQGQQNKSKNNIR